MPQLIEFEGQVHEFPDDFSQEEIAAALSSYRPPAAPGRSATRLQEFRAQYPEYGDLSDQQLADSLYRKLYSDIPRADFNARIGLATPSATPAPPPGQPPAPPIATADGGYTFDAPEPGPAPDRWQRAVRNLQVGVQGAGRGLADLAGLPGDLSTGAANVLAAAAELALSNVALPAARAVLPERAERALLPAGDVTVPRFPRSPVGGDAIAEAASDLAGAAGIDVIPAEAMTPRERLAYNVNRFGTEAVASGGALARRAALEPIEETAKRAPRMADALLNPYKVDPGKALKTDAAAGAGAGATLTAVQDVAPDYGLDGPVTDYLAMMTGAFGGASAATGGRVAIDAGKGVARRVMTDKAVPGLVPTSRRTADRASAFVQGQTTGKPSDVAATIKARNAEAAAHGEPAPTPGIASGDIGLTALERAARLRDPVPFQVADQRLRDAAEARVAGLRDATADVEAPGREIGHQVDQQRQQARRAVTDTEAAQARLEAERLDAGEGVKAYAGRKDEASAAIDALIRETLEREARSKTDLFNAVDPDGTVVLDAKPMGDAVQALRDSIPRTVDENAVLPNNILKRWTEIAEGGAVMFKELNNARPYLASAAKSARAAGNESLARNIDKLRGFIGDTTEALAMQGHNEAGSRAAAALENYKVRFAPRFREGEGGRFAADIKRDVYGTATRPTDTARRFLTSKEAADDFNRIMEIADNPKAGYEAARTWMLDRMAGVVGADGKINVAGLRKWRDLNKSVIDRLPGFGDEVNGMLRKAVNGDQQESALAAQLKAAQKAQKLTEDQIRQSAAALLLDEDPVKAAGRVLSAGPTKGAALMRELTSRLGGNAEALKGWKRAVSEYLIDRVTGTNTAISQGADGPVSVAKLQAVFKENEKALAAVYSPQEMQALRRAHKMLEPLGNLSRQATNANAAADHEMLWNTVEAGLLGVTGNAIKTGMVMKRIRVALKFLPNENARVQHLIDRMWFEPELAQHLLTKPVAEVPTPAWNKRLQQLLAVGEAARENDPE